jgi:hypothetical protein
VLTPLTYTYNSLTGVVTAQFPSAGTALQRQTVGSAIRAYFTVEHAYQPAQDEYLLAMPYYEQVGGSCWATDGIMIWRAMQRGVPNPQLEGPLKFAAVPDDDFGGGYLPDPLRPFYVVTRDLPRYLTSVIPANAEWRGYDSMTHLRWRLLRVLDAGHPLIVRMPGHTVLVIGYRQRGSEFILHDSQGLYPASSKRGGMYNVRPYSWWQQMQGSLNLVAFQAVWVDGPIVPRAERTLQTLGLPGADETGGSALGLLRFTGANPQTGTETTAAQMQFRPSATLGYRWIDGSSNELPAIPVTARELHLIAPVWNADSNAVTRDVRLQVYAGSTRLGDEYNTVVLPRVAVDSDADKRAALVEVRIPMDELRQPAFGDVNGTLRVTLFGELLDGTTPIDGWQVVATLGLTPVITSVSPSSGQVGTETTIIGSGFGRLKAADATVTFNGKPAVDILAWSDTEIRVRVPAGATTGNIVVATRNEAEYYSNGVAFTIGQDNLAFLHSLNEVHVKLLGTANLKLTATGEIYQDNFSGALIAMPVIWNGVNFSASDSSTLPGATYTMTGTVDPSGKRLLNATVAWKNTHTGQSMEYQLVNLDLTYTSQPDMAWYSQTGAGVESHVPNIVWGSPFFTYQSMVWPTASLYVSFDKGT